MNSTELQYPAPYAIEDGYLGYKSRQPKGREAFVRLCNFFPFVQSQVLCDNGLEGHVQVEIGAFQTDGTPLPTVTLNGIILLLLDI